ncbi:hybrid sensor histidine kinase/response regulator [Algoriphagus sp. NF]|jgi:Signal transduction histidine kinase|uniref:histidine kinase n=3 Tax=Algoriphagus TaxID=246875 RepID=A0ABS7N3U2_9BACT|nr:MULTISPECIES: hybrid sensor histidine kinase/response regulator [Algoriphagus]MBY5951003.1 hybrid sensor histidine kinase/response regulator [Algoriphagus marincola]MDE0558675.1 hybrid sensor histidine kinase/response regulator [Algoriphagus sp. NF]
MNSSDIRVLYIDDEDNNLKSFRATLRKDFKIFTAIDAFEGLKIVQEEEIHVVIADQRMPGMTGTEFFEKMIEINPDPVRILLTGYSDIASVIDAINKGEVYRFIDKPWNIEQIKNSIKNAADIFFMRRELKEKNIKLEKLHSEMNQFVYSLSHELRGPLMSISGVSKLAKMEIKDPHVLEFFDMIDTATTKLDDFIYKMLDFYRSTKIDHKITQIDFKEVVNQQMEAYRAKFDLSHFHVELQVNQEEPFFSDDSKIRVILNNLFSNSVQFMKNEHGEKRIALTIDVRDGEAIVMLEDNGIGIEDRHHPEVFNLFTRATQQNVGTGLGLYMVKEAVEQLGGKVELESILNEGTTVRVVLPSLNS